MDIRWGIIGCGNVTEIKSGPAFNKVNGSTLVAIMRRNEDLARDYAARHNVPSWYTDADELIGDPAVNAVYIATPPSTHADYAVKAMNAGKIVYVEKPMAADYSECMRMIEESEKTGAPLFVAYYRRHLPYFIKVKELLSCGVLGRLLYGEINFHSAPRPEDFNPDTLPWRVKPEISGGGYFYDMACHQLDLMDWFFGEATEVHGSSYNRRNLYKAEDTVFARLLYKSGVPVNAQWCFAAGNNEHADTIIIHGEKGSLEFSTFDFTPIKVSTISGIEAYLPENPENIQYWCIRSMVEKLINGSKEIGNGREAARANWIMDKILGKIQS
jgi:predicted dehydrogenase